jgi:propanol-preferring alcohol dehydrogenase
MKAAVVTAFKKPLEIKQVEIPKPGVNDVLIKNIACGVCHTDLHTVNGGKIKLKLFTNNLFSFSV